MYSYLLQGDEKIKRNITSRLLFLEADANNKNALYGKVIEKEDVDLLKKDIREYENSLFDGSWLENICHYKPWGSSKDECQYCKLGKQIFGI